MTATPTHDRRVLLSAAYDKSVNTLRDLSRVDPATFCEHVLTDEETGKAVKLAPVHEEWHEALSANDRLIIWSHVEAGKTSQISVGRALWELGRDTTLRIVILSSTKSNAEKITRAQAQYISRSDKLRGVFPGLMPAKDNSLPWTSNALTVERPTFAKDASIQAVGFGGHIIGSRIDLLIIDDILDAENTSTPMQMAKVLSWIRSSALGRLTERARVWGVTNAWHPKDAMHVLAAEGGYASMRSPVVRSDGSLSWPARWSHERIESVTRDLGPLEAGRQLHCRARDDDSSAFKQEWLDLCIAKGEGYTLVDRLDRVPDGYAVFTGVDLAVQQHAAADLSSFFTILLHPNGDRQLLWLEAGRWTGPEIVSRVEAHEDRFGSIQIVENVGAQDYILQFARLSTRAKLKPFTTGRNKANPDFGVASLAAELAGGRWIIPSKKGAVVKEVDAWLQEMLFYNPRAHTGDRLMSSWFAREGARSFEKMFPKRVHGQPIVAQTPRSAGVRSFSPGT